MTSTNDLRTRLPEQAVSRVLKVANGATINGTYEKMPIAALEAFKTDLRAMCAALDERDELLKRVMDELADSECFHHHALAKQIDRLLTNPTPAKE